MKSLFAHIIILTSFFCATAQEVIPIKKYYDEDSVHIKELFYVKKSDPKILDGSYVSYYFNGNKKREGEYQDNEAIGDWLFYYESEMLKMTGPLTNNQSNGYWKYYFENGNLKMEGNLIDNKKDGKWTYYHENGQVKGMGDYKNDLKNGVWIYNHEDGEFKAQAEYSSGKGTYYEFYDNGKMKMTGPIENEKSNGHWQYFDKEGTIESEGEEVNGLKQGSWKFYYTNGKLKSEGAFNKGKASGDWKYYHDNGNIKAEGKKQNDFKTGYWKVMFETGALQSEANYDNVETGEYTEYFPSGKLKIEGQYFEGKHHGIWKYYYESGEKEGICNYNRGIGYYKGYTKDQQLKIEGKLNGSDKIGTWILYDSDGDISGYYHTYDNTEHPVFSATVEHKNTLPSGHFNSSSNKNKWKNFQKTKFYQTLRSHNTQMDAFIFSIDPLAPGLGRATGTYEYWVGKKYGHELLASYLRNPFLENFSNLNNGKISKEGYSFAYRFKFYNESLMSGYVHFDNELRFNQNILATNVVDETGNNLGLKSTENTYEYSFIFGNRYLFSRDQHIKRYVGWTLDTFLGLGVGFRTYNDSWKDNSEYDKLFSTKKGNIVTIPLRLGITIGYSF